MSSQHISAPETDYLFTATSQIEGAGQGLFTAVNIYKEEIIAYFKGERLTDKEAALRSANGRSSYFINMPDGGIMDCMHVRSFAKYANDPQGYIKTQFRTNCYITLDDDEHVCLIANRNISAGAEIFCNYGKRYWKKFAQQKLPLL